MAPKRGKQEKTRPSMAPKRGEQVKVGTSMTPRRGKQASSMTSTDKRKEEILREFTTEEEIKTITENYREEIGRGGFSTVYKGTWEDKAVSIKVYNDKASCRSQWTRETRHLKELQHEHIIRLLGYYGKSEKHILVYEYMPHTLSTRFEELNWSDILKILKQAASALQYLHERKLVFADFKLDNVLLDQANNVKLTDFGGITGHGQLAEVSTEGSSAPEVFKSGTGYIKSDIYSFGVLILQLVMKIKVIGTQAPESDNGKRSKKGKQIKKSKKGKETQTESNEEDSENIVTKAKKAIEKSPKGIVTDEQELPMGCSMEKARKITELAMKCVKSFPDARPSIDQVIQNLNQM